MSLFVKQRCTGHNEVTVIMMLLKIITSNLKIMMVVLMKRINKNT